MELLLFSLAPGRFTERVFFKELHSLSTNPLALPKPVVERGIFVSVAGASAKAALIFLFLCRNVPFPSFFLFP